MAKFDYDDIAFYQEVFRLASQGMTDGEIADGLREKFGETLSPSTFSSMKAGRYAAWSDDENARRSEQLREAIERGSRRLLAAIKGRYLKVALGGIKYSSG